MYGHILMCWGGVELRYFFFIMVALHNPVSPPHKQQSLFIAAPLFVTFQS